MEHENDQKIRERVRTDNCFYKKKTKKIWIEIDLIKVINFDQKPDEKNGLKSSLDCAYVWCVAVNTELRINQVQYGRLYDFSRAKKQALRKKRTNCH